MGLSLLLLGAVVVSVGVGCQTGGDIGESSGGGGGGKGGGGINGGGGVVINLDAPSVIAASLATCGNGKEDENEQCDIGQESNGKQGAGCTKTCQIVDGFECPKFGEDCRLSAKCGDGKLTSTETCDDGNTTSGDGCSSACDTVEDGFECRVPGRTCNPKCGDSKKINGESCDDGNNKSEDGCSSTCQVEPGYDCPTLGQPCVGAKCGNAIREVGELCDCGTDPTKLPADCKSVNGLFYGDGKGCSKTCTKEPTCRDSATGKNRACDAVCGDGNVDPGEDCDDGDGDNGDGCSDKCKVEEGFSCSTNTKQDSEDCQETSGQCLRLPVIYRDFKPQNESGGHPDFYWLSKTQWCVPNSGGPSKGNDSTDRCWDIAGPELINGKPQPGNGKTCACQFSDWSVGNSSDHIGGNYAKSDSPLDGRSDVNDWTDNGGGIWNGTVASYKDASSFKQWFADDSSVNKTYNSVLELPSIGTNVYQYASKSRKLDGGFFPLDTLNPDQKTLCNMWPYWNAKFFPSCRGDQYLFPPRIQSSDCPSGDDYLDGCWLTGLTGVKHDSYFTDEARYYFNYDSSAGISLQFFGDDDLFIFINGKLALDLGGVHQQLPGKVTVTGNPGASQATIVEGGCLDTAGNIIGASAGSNACSPKNSTPPTAASPADFRNRKMDLNLENGKTYEIAIFGADRHPPESNYQLTLQGFTTKRSDCSPRCGDGIISGGEECDCGDDEFKGTRNGDCLGPNKDGEYGGCGKDCRFGPFCGDGTQNGPEQCDKGKDNGASYGENGCTVGCTTPHYCGDGIVDSGEACDLGDNNGQKGMPCSSSCEFLINPP